MNWRKLFPGTLGILIVNIRSRKVWLSASALEVIAIAHARKLPGDAKQRLDTLEQRLENSEVMQIRTLRSIEREDDAQVFA